MSRIWMCLLIGMILTAAACGPGPGPAPYEPTGTSWTEHVTLDYTDRCHHFYVGGTPQGFVVSQAGDFANSPTPLDLLSFQGETLRHLDDTFTVGEPYRLTDGRVLLRGSSGDRSLLDSQGREVDSWSNDPAGTFPLVAGDGMADYAVWTEYGDYVEGEGYPLFTFLGRLTDGRADQTPRLLVLDSRAYHFSLNGPRMLVDLGEQGLYLTTLDGESLDRAAPLDLGKDISGKARKRIFPFGDGFALAWLDWDASRDDQIRTYLTFVNTDGRAVYTQHLPHVQDVTYNGYEFVGAGLVDYQGQEYVALSRFDRSGDLKQTGLITAFEEDQDNNHYPSIVSWGNHYAVSWGLNQRDSEGDAYIRDLLTLVTTE